MHSRFRTKGVLLAALVAFLATAALPGAASAEPQPGAPKKGFRLFARALGALTINRMYLGLSSSGQVGVDSSNSSTIGGGFWPKGTPDQYVFNSGIQVAGIIGPEGGPWANDTVGGFFFDPKGTTEHGEQVQPIYNATSTSDLSSWPAAACVPTEDPARGGADFNGALFHPLLQADSSTGPTGDGTGVPYCRKTASQGDVWFMSWDGNNTLKAGRKHPLGVAVETRGMGWNFPAGNEDITYFIYTFYNITTTNRADYIANGIRGSMADILVQKAQDYHAGIAAQGISGVPTTGYTINNLFAAFAADMDVSDAGANYSTVNLPFAMGNTYDHAFGQPSDWLFDPSIFGAPFFAGVGFVGVKYLKSPTGVGAIQLFSNTVNGTPFAGAVNDPRDVLQLYRYLSGTLSPSFGDQSCQYNPVTERICFVNNTQPADMRFFQSSTPLSLAPGQGGSIVVAYIMAAPVPSGNCPSPTCDVKPGDPRLLTNPFTLASAGANAIDTLTGFLDYDDANANNIVEQAEFTVVPGSLLGKALTAQAVFDAKFLLPFAPTAPEFFLIPGDNQVTVMWKPSPAEASGDPYFAVANAAQVFDPNVGANVNNALYDPNYRQFDVEGYRVYRGRVDAPNELTLLAQFDYAGTIISDYVGVVNPNPDCAPEYGILTGCPVAFPSGGNQKDGTTLTVHEDYDIVGDLIQVNAGGGRIELATGQVYVTKADTAVVGGGKNGNCGPKSACGDLANQGVPFVYVDATPRNSFRYFYSVTAFDVNSIESGPTSLESPRNTKSVTPVKPAGNYENTAKLSLHVKGSRNGVQIDENQDEKFPKIPTIDPVTGRFSGPFPPADGTSLGFVGEFVKQVVKNAGSLELTLDSIGGGSAYDGTPTTYYMTAAAGGSPPVSFVIPIVQDAFDATHSDVRLFEALNIDDGLAKRYGGDGSYTLQAEVGVNLAGNYYTNSYGRGCVNGAPGYDLGAGCQYNGPRWFNGPSPQNNETKAHPNDGNWKNFTSPFSMNRAPVNGITNGGFNNAGELSGVEVIHQPYSYNTMGNQYRDVEGVLGSFKRAADYNVYWNSGTPGLIDSVIDVTHNVEVAFDSLRMNASYGLLTAALTPTSGTGALSSYDRRAEVSNTDFGCVEPMRSSSAAGGRIACGGTTAGGDGPVYYMTRQASIDPIVFFTITPSDVRTSTNTGTGFAMYIAGNTFLFQTNTLPSGTVWSLRDYVGAVTGGNGWGGNVGPYAYFKQDALTNIPLPFSAVGASIAVDFDLINAVRAPKYADLKKVHTVPDPYYVTNQFEQSTDNKVIKFVNLPEQAVIRIYSASGVLVNVLEHNTSTFGGELSWNVRNRNNQVVASGVYFYHIEATQGDSKTRRVGKMTIVNFAQ